MTAHPGSDPSSINLADVVQTLDWESGVPDSRAVRRDPRMPSLSRSAGFLASIAGGWGEADRQLAVEPGAAQAAERHRTRLSAQLPGETIVVAAGRAHVRANDNFFEFRAAGDFIWLVGCGLDDAVLVMRPIAGGHDAVLYITPPARPGDDAFFRDSIHGELWVG